MRAVVASVMIYVIEKESCTSSPLCAANRRSSNDPPSRSEELRLSIQSYRHNCDLLLATLYRTISYP